MDFHKWTTNLRVCFSVCVYDDFDLSDCYIIAARMAASLLITAAVIDAPAHHSLIHTQRFYFRLFYSHDNILLVNCFLFHGGFGDLACAWSINGSERAHVY